MTNDIQNTLQESQDEKIDLFKKTKNFIPAFIFSIIAGFIICIMFFLPIYTLSAEQPSTKTSLFRFFISLIRMCFSVKDFPTGIVLLLGYIQIISIGIFSIIFIIKYITFLFAIKKERQIAMFRICKSYLSLFKLLVTLCLIVISANLIISKNITKNVELAIEIKNAIFLIQFLPKSYCYVYLTLSVIGLILIGITNRTTSLTKLDIGSNIYNILRFFLNLTICILLFITPIIQLTNNDSFFELCFFGANDTGLLYFSEDKLIFNVNEISSFFNQVENSFPKGSDFYPILISVLTVRILPVFIIFTVNLFLTSLTRIIFTENYIVACFNLHGRYIYLLLRIKNL